MTVIGYAVKAPKEQVSKQARWEQISQVAGTAI